MIISTVDSINSIFQSIMFIYVSNYYSKKKKSTLVMIAWIIILWSIIQGTRMICKNSSLETILIHLIILIVITLIFREDSLGSMIRFSIVYLLIGAVTIISSTIYLSFIQRILPDEYLQIGIVIFMHIPQYVIFILIIYNKYFINSIYEAIKGKSITVISLVIATVIVDFIVSFKGLVYDIENLLYKQIVFVYVAIFMIGLAIYFSNIKEKSNQISDANKLLLKKNQELKKLKHDYGAQISYLYGLHLMAKYERVGIALKEIIEMNNSISTEIELLSKTNSIISDIVHGMDHEGVNIIINDEIDINDINISESDYRRVIFNILTNITTAMDRKGTIEIKTYYSFKYVIVSIKSKGIKNEETIVESELSTKENKRNDKNFDLTIVKEIIDINKGSIKLKSNNMVTEFIIKIPKIKSN